MNNTINKLVVALKEACINNNNVEAKSPAFHVTYNHRINETTIEVFFTDYDYDSFDVTYAHNSDKVVISGNWFNASVQTIKRFSLLGHTSKVKKLTSNINTMFIRAVENS